MCLQAVNFCKSINLSCLDSLSPSTNILLVCAALTVAVLGATEFDGVVISHSKLSLS